MRTLSLLTLALLATACRTNKDTGDPMASVDRDADGYNALEDCDDLDEAIHPDADELCDGIDNDCDGTVDVDATDALSWYADADSDGYGDAEAGTAACEQPPGYVFNDQDCDDADPRINPGAPEDDCTDPVDYNCDGSVGYADADGDGFAACEDCDDSRADVNDDADEVCDGADNDCDGDVDVDAVDATTWYADSDGDGYGGTRFTEEACEAPDGYVDNADDCDDLDAASYPGGTEVCDGADNDCNGSVDDSPLDDTFWYADADGDGYGDIDSYLEACDAPTGFVADASDCDDASAHDHPGAWEVCDGSDNDCDGDTDEDDAVDASTWYADDDSDGYGDAGDSTDACDQPSGYVSTSTDCDDTDDEISPAAVEYCDEVDNDCDGSVDEADAADAQLYYTDSDGDGYGTGRPRAACEQPSGTADNDDDCDDSDDEISPAAVEYCDEVDNDCDGSTDEDAAADAELWYDDLDGDGYGAGSSDPSCEQPSGKVSDDTDCDDGDSSIHPGASEYCDYQDNDCDGATDEDDSVDAETWYYDDDGDGYGDNGDTTTACTDPGSDWVSEGDDCDDADAAYNPGATEGCDGEDYDCDGSVDSDADGDGYADESCGGDDCDDDNAAIYPDSTGACSYGADCQEVYDNGYTTDDAYPIDPDGVGGEDPIEVWCDMDTSSGYGWTLCASLTKGYVPSHMLYDEDFYAFQARLNGDDDYVYETDAPARYTATWNDSEDLNYGQFCRLMGTGMSYTRIQAKMWNWSNNYGATLKNTSYSATYEGVYSGNLYLQWFTNSSASRSFSRVSGDQLYVTDNNNGYGGSYTTPNVSWSGGASAYTHSTNPWNSVTSSSSCVGCTDSGSGYTSLPYGSTTILNDMSHSFWSGIPNVRYGWSDCTANGNCDYHESGYGVWLFWVR